MFSGWACWLGYFLPWIAVCPNFVPISSQVLSKEQLLCHIKMHELSTRTCGRSSDSAEHRRASNANDWTCCWVNGEKVNNTASSFTRTPDAPDWPLNKLVHRSGVREEPRFEPGRIWGLEAKSKMLSCIPLKKIKSCSVTVKAYSMALLKFVCFICAIEFQTEISGLEEARGFSLCDPECSVCSLCSEFLEQPHKIMYKQWWKKINVHSVQK